MSTATLFKPADLAERMRMARDWALIALAEREACDAALEAANSSDTFEGASRRAVDDHYAAEQTAVDELLALLASDEMQAEIAALKGGA